MPDRSDISPLSITDGKISKGAKIDPTKLAPATSGQVLIAGTDGKFRPGNLVTTSSGDTVAQGPAGATGATGSQGATGATGATGAAGVDGTDATVTPENVDGALGFTGSTAGLVKRTADNTFELDTATYSTTGHDHTLADISDSGGAAALDVWAGAGPPAGTVCAGDDLRLGDTRNPNSHKSTHSTGGTDALSPSDIGASASGHTHSYSSLTGTPSTFAPSSHNHDHNALTNYAVGQHRVINDSGTESTELWSAHNINYHLGGKEPSIGTKNTAFNKNFGTATGDVCQGDDSRLSDARTPSSTLTHKATHATGGADALTPADIGASAVDHTHSYADITSKPSTFTPSAHSHDAMSSSNSYATGFVPAGSATHSDKFLRRDGTWVIPAGTSSYTADDGIGLTGSAFSVAAGTGLTQDSTGLSLNLQGVTEEAVRVDEDYLVFLDGGSTGAAKKESIEDLATAMAGAGLTASSGELRIDFKYARSIEWATTQSNVSYNVGNTIATLTHNLGSSYVMVSVKDVDGVLHNSNASSTGGYLLDLDYDALIKVVDSNNISIEFDIGTTEMDAIITNNNEFQVTVIG